MINWRLVLQDKETQKLKDYKKAKSDKYLICQIN